MRRRAVALALALALTALAGCGRIGFDTGDRDAAPAGGVRWIRVYPATTTGSAARVTAAVPDGNGGAAVVVPFSGTIEVDGAPITSQGLGINSLVTTIQPTGMTRWIHALHAGNQCDLRAVELTAANTVLAGGLSSGALQSSGDPCDLGANTPQDPLLVDYDADGNFAARVSWDATGQNAQLWQVRAHPDGSRAILGIYGGNLMVNGVALPPAPACCDGTFIARVGGPVAELWQDGFTSATEVYPRVLDLDETTGDVCLAGWFDSTTTIAGTPLTTAGSDDVWVARLGPDGAAKFVRSLGSVAQDDVWGVIAGSDGGCAVAVRYNADLALDGAAGPLMNHGGPDTAVIRLAADGAVVGAGSVGSPGNEVPAGLVTAGGNVFVAVELDAPLTIGGTTITPQGRDAVLIQLTGDVPDTVVAVITGAGDLNINGVAVRNGELVIYGDYTGELRIGEFADTRADQSGFVIEGALP